MYNVPGRTGQDIPVETMMSVAGHQHFAGVKECMGRERIQAYSDLGVTTWCVGGSVCRPQFPASQQPEGTRARARSGNDDECHETRHEAGCQGVISVTSNLVPALFSQMMKEPSPEVAAQCEDLINWLFEEPNPIGVNTMMMMLGMCQPVFRLPYLQLDPEARKRGKAIIEAVGLECAPQLLCPRCCATCQGSLSWPAWPGLRVDCSHLEHEALLCAAGMYPGTTDAKSSRRTRTSIRTAPRCKCENATKNT
eukprot:COSAG01_NODE_243_length_20572_cov_24.956137_17_plen_252_part_00